MRLGRILAVGLLSVAGLAVTGIGVTSLTAGAWAQSQNYPQQPPNVQASGNQQPPNGQYPSAQAPADPQAQDPQAQGNVQGPGGAPAQGDPQNQGDPQAQGDPQNQQEQSYPQGQGDPQAQGPQGPGAQGPGGPGGPNVGPNGETAQKSEGPAPDVARISLIYGDVTTQRGDTGDWSVTTVNAPVMRGDQVATGEKSRTEIQLDYADILRMAARSQVKIADLAHNRIQVQVAQGYTNYTMLKGGEADVEIDSPNVAVHPLKPGSYRVQVNSDSETDVIVRSGEAEITTPQGSTRVKEGELITIHGTDSPEYKISAAPQKDDWDRWNNDRDNVIREADGPRRTNRYYTGAADLDGYGHWNNVPGYGNVWQPYQQGNWAPYQSGRWVWQPFYGWTWVSYEPWGWAPYHYGRWFYYQDSWCWWPGPVYSGYRPLWSPAFVFFVGFGPRVGFGFGSIGWFPVGPHDAFYPWYGRGFNRVNVVSITNINVVNRGGFIAPLAVRGRQPFFSNANLVMTNAHVRGSVTSVSSANFGRGVATGGFRRGVEENELRESHVMTANLPVVPTRESLRAGSSTVPAGVQTRNSGRFFTQHQPPAGPESFHDQAARVQRVVGSEAGARGETMNRAEGGNVNTRGNAEAPRTGGASANGLSGRQGSTQPAGENRQTGSDSSSSSRSGWSHFGSPAARSSGEAGNGRTESNAPGSRSTDVGRSSRTDSASEGNRGMQSQNASPRSQEGSGSNWHHFPTNDSSANRGNTRTNESQSGRGGESSASKPPLELHRPIVTPRQSDTRSHENAPSSSRSSEGRSAPSYSPRYSPRYSPPPSQSGSSGSSRPAPSSGRSSGGSNKSSGGHSESKSSGKH
jgi:uncharacterized protein DUF6600/FecR-like protein